MVKHTQTIRRQITDELFVFDHFVGLAFKALNFSKIGRRALLNWYKYIQIRYWLLLLQVTSFIT